MSLQKKAYGRLLLCLLLTMAFACLLVHSLAGGTLLVHSVYDSYALQAENWLAGRTWIADGEKYTWLELAVYEGRYYVSFPPVPSVLALPWAAFLGGAQAVPSNLLAALYGLFTAAGVFSLLARRGAAPLRCLFWAVLICCGSGFWWMSTNGGVWFTAQVLNLCFVAWGLFFACGDGTAQHTLAAFLLALAVGCRPFSILLLALYMALLLARGAGAQTLLAAAGKSGALYEKLPPPKRGRLHRPGADFWLPLAAAAAVGAALAWYNWMRFGSILEFGHNYLPEFVRAKEGQFSMAYFLPNLVQMLRPVVLNKQLNLVFPVINGFSLFLANPAFLLWAVQLARRARQKRLSWLDAAMVICWMAALAALCVHKTMGGWQFGARYTVDLLPYVLLTELPLRPEKHAQPRASPDFRAAPPAGWEWMLCVWAVLFNLYGAVYMLGR